MSPTPAPASAKRPRRWGLIAPVAIFAAAALGWTIHWNLLKADAERTLQTVLTGERAAGAEFNAGIARAWGFPRELALELENIAYAPPDRAWRMTTAHARLNINPVNPRHIILELDSPMTFAFPGRPDATLTAENLRVSLRFARDGAVQDAGVESADIAYADPVPNGRGFTAERIVANLRAAPNSTSGHQLAIDIEGLSLNSVVETLEPLGRAIAAMNLRLALTHAVALFAPPHIHPLEAWRIAGGAVRLDGVRLQWGLARFTAQGMASFDQSHRPLVNATLKFEDPAPLFRAMAEAPQSPPPARAMFAAQTAPDISLEAADGVLRLERTPLRPLDPAY